MDGAGSNHPVVLRGQSPWPLPQRIKRVAWGIVSLLLFRTSFHNFYSFRRWLLRFFGAKIGSNVRIRPTVRIEIPWNLDIAEGTAIGDFAILYALGPIRIGRMVTVSQYAHLCAGTHDYTRRDMPLLCQPIAIGDDVWIGADAFVGPGVSVGERSIIGARSTVMSDVPGDQIFSGNPARFIKARPAIRDGLQ